MGTVLEIFALLLILASFFLGLHGRQDLAHLPGDPRLVRVCRQHGHGLSVGTDAENASGLAIDRPGLAKSGRRSRTRERSPPGGGRRRSPDRRTRHRPTRGRIAPRSGRPRHRLVQCQCREDRSQNGRRRTDDRKPAAARHRHQDGSCLPSSGRPWPRGGSTWANSKSPRATATPRRSKSLPICR